MTDNSPNNSEMTTDTQVMQSSRSLQGLQERFETVCKAYSLEPRLGLLAEMAWVFNIELQLNLTPSNKVESNVEQ